jgi:hypothetical protein
MLRFAQHDNLKRIFILLDALKTGEIPGSGFMVIILNGKHCGIGAPVGEKFAFLAR